jgi:hypothetical protein
MFLAFMAFVLIWFGIGMWATTRKLPDIVAWGGGAALSLLITVGLFQLVGGYSAHQAIQAEQRQDGTISKSHLLKGMGDFAPVLGPAPTADGRARALGKTQGGSIGILEVSGKALDVDVEKATLTFMAVLNDDQAMAANLRMATQYVQTLFPEWVTPGTWLESNALTSPETKTVAREGRRITVTLSKELNMWFLVVEKV